MALKIVEERLFGPDGKQLALTVTPRIPSLRAYRQALGSKVAQMLRKRLPDLGGGKPTPAVIFRLYDGRTLMAIFGQDSPTRRRSA